MVTPCKFVYPYFDNPQMLEFQVENWNGYDADLRAAVEIILVDDCSSKPALPILEHCQVPVRAYRLAKRFPWNMHECRNIGAYEACSATENAWLFMCDIDTVLEPEMARRMLTTPLDPSRYYTMDYVSWMDPNDHMRTMNMFLVRHGAYWRVNGYDLDLTPIGGGGHGGARQFRKQLNRVVDHEHLGEIVLVDYSGRRRDSTGRKLEGPGSRMIEDASTEGHDRAMWQLRFKEALKRKQASGNRRSLNPIRSEYTQILSSPGTATGDLAAAV